MTDGEYNERVSFVSPSVNQMLLSGEPGFVDELCDDEFEREKLIEQIEFRQRCSRDISNYFAQLPSPTITPTEALTQGLSNAEKINCMYESLSEILKDPDCGRLALYLPFELLGEKDEDVSSKIANSMNSFKEDYLNAWGNLLTTHDMRANFVDGDVFEVDARPDDPPRVVKAAHLSPWLIKAGLIEPSDLVYFMDHSKDPILQRSILDTVPVIESMGLLSGADKMYFEYMDETVPKQAPQEPLYVSEGRKAWLASEGAYQKRLFQDDVQFRQLRDLVKPNVNNNKINQIASEINHALSDPNASQMKYPIMLLNGSLIKGYGNDNSDVDTYVFTDQSQPEALPDGISYYNPYPIMVEHKSGLAALPSKEQWAHEVFGSMWIGDKPTIKNMQRHLTRDYINEKDPTTRQRCIERVEQDVLQYRLLHKGYARHYPSYKVRVPGDKNIDGASEFYDPGFRQIATQLYVNKVFLPKI